MKRIKIYAILLAVAIIAGVSIFYACEKEDSSKNMDNQVYENTKKASTITSTFDIGLPLWFQPHRGILKRPRDGKKCACMSCFGLCNTVHINNLDDFDLYNGFLNLNIKSSTGVLYILEDMPHAESEFGIDFPVFISKEYLTSEIIKKYSILAHIIVTPDEYVYIPNKKMIKINDKITRQSYGEVKIKFIIE